MELEGLEEKIMIYNGNDWTSLDRSQFKPSMWTQIKLNFYKKIDQEYHDGVAFFYGAKEYYSHQKIDDTHAVLTPEYGTLYVDATGDTPVYDFWDVKQGTHPNTDGVTKEAILRYNPLGPLIHDWFSDEELDYRDKEFQKVVSRTWKTAGYTLTFAAGGFALAGETETASAFFEISEIHSSITTFTTLIDDVVKGNSKKLLYDIGTAALFKAQGKAFNMRMKQVSIPVKDRNLTLMGMQLTHKITSDILQYKDTDKNE